MLARDLRNFMLDEGHLLQYVDNLFIARPAYKLSTKYHKNPGLSGIVDMFFQKKAQVCKQQFTFLGFVLSQGQWSLLHDRKQAIAGKTHRQLRRFLGMAGVCQIWIPNYGLLVKPFSEALKGQDFKPLLGLHGAKKPLKQWKQSLSQPWVWDYQT